MKKILLITKREYTSRVMKKSFLIMTILGPILIAAFYAVIIYFTINENIGSEEKQFAVVDHSGKLKGRLQDSENLKFIFTDSTEANLEVYDGVLEIPTSIDPAKGMVKVKSSENLSLQSKSIISGNLEDAYEKMRMEDYGISKTLLDSVSSNIQVLAYKVEKDGTLKDSSSELFTIIGIVLAGAIYFFIFLYGVQVMRGVIEEKTNRIVEVIVSSVKPFQLMMGKVLGIAAVGLTQIIIWIALSGILISVISMSFAQDQLPDMKQLEQMGQAAQQMPVSDMQQLFAGFKSLNLPLIALTFIFYFAGGYLLYSALFAAVGAAVDNETETQQFMLPITLPLVLAFVLSTSVVMRDPNGQMAFWLSIIPFTSPVVMMVRIPFMSFPTQAWELGLSMLLLIAFFIGTIWVAGRIYRTGILMYGKKATYGELLKWLFYKS